MIGRLGAFLVGYLLGARRQPPADRSVGLDPGEVGELRLSGNVRLRPEDSWIVGSVTVGVGDSEFNLDMTAESLDTTAAWFSQVASAVRSAQIERINQEGER